MSDWIKCSDRLPPVAKRLDEPCVIEGRVLAPLNRSIQVIAFDGKHVFGSIIEWFDGEMPHRGETHWMPLPTPPTE